jgi:hypothetical protein
VCGQPQPRYAFSADHANDQILGVLRSKDAGKTWACPHLGIDPALNRFQLSQPWDMGLQAPRDLGIAVHPTNPEQILLSGRRSGLLGSTNGGADFDTAAWPPVLDDTFHGDNRLVTYDESTGAPRVLVGSDGGAVRQHRPGRQIVVVGPLPRTLDVDDRPRAGPVDGLGR